MRVSNKYLFIISPPYSGSTVLWRLLQTSASVSALPTEGQKLPELVDMMRRDPWNPNTTFDWHRIREVWMQYWDLSRPVLLEKSPPHLCRYRELNRHFAPSNHLLLIRDPIATCEALHRRNGWDYSDAAERWLWWLELHLECRDALSHSMTLYYEDMTDEPVRSFQQLANWMPELGDVAFESSVEAHSVHGVARQPLRNLNASKLERVTEADRAAVCTVLATQKKRMAETPYYHYVA